MLTAAAAPAAARAALEPVAEVVTAGEDRVDLAAAVDALAARGLRRILSEGGRRLGGLVAAGRLDELCLTVSPLLAGAGAGHIIAGGGHPPVPLRILRLLAEDDSLFTRYAVARPVVGDCRRGPAHHPPVEPMLAKPSTRSRPSPG